MCVCRISNYTKKSYDRIHPIISDQIILLTFPIISPSVKVYFTLIGRSHIVFTKVNIIFVNSRFPQKLLCVCKMHIFTNTAKIKVWKNITQNVHFVSDVYRQKKTADPPREQQTAKHRKQANNGVIIIEVFITDTNYIENHPSPWWSSSQCNGCVCVCFGAPSHQEQ